MNPQSNAAWNANQERVALLLAAGKAIKSAALEVGAGERTVHEWLTNPGYRALVGEFRQRLIGEALGRLVSATNDAADTLAGLLNDPNPNVKLRAATSILDSVVRLREHSDLAERIEELERRTVDRPEGDS